MATKHRAANRHHAVFLGNLEDGNSKEDVANMIVKLVLQVTGLTLELAAIRVRHSVPCRCLTASISFSSQAKQHRALVALNSFKSNTNTISFEGLVKKGRTLKVDTYKPKLVSQGQRAKDDDVVKNGQSHVVDTNKRKISAQPRIHNDTETNSGSYVKGQQLGNETRILEFKRGGGDLKECLKRHLAKYTCAFLNAQGGALMIGVDDLGTVQGVCCDRKEEDNLRINIDNIIHKFEPPVLPQTYSVKFVPVKDQFGTISDLKVIEIAMNAGRPNTLYETPNGEVYIRRDGSLRGPLRARDIQEWCRLKFSSEFSAVETNLQQRVDALQERLKTLEAQKCNASTQEDSESPTDYSREIKRTRSSVCTIL